MARRAPRRWHEDAFKVGVLGIALMLAGYFAMRWVPEAAAAPPYGLPGRLTFYLGLAVIAGACVLWYRQAQTEEAPHEEPADEEADV